MHKTLRNYNCDLLFRFEESVTVFFHRFCCVRFFASDFVGVSDFSPRLQIFVQIVHSDFCSVFCFRFFWCLRFFTQSSDFCLDWFTQIFVQIFASDFFGVSDFSLRFFKSFRFFSFQISDELQILEMAQIFSHSDFRRFRFSPDF